MTTPIRVRASTPNIKDAQATAQDVLFKRSQPDTVWAGSSQPLVARASVSTGLNQAQVLDDDP